MSKSREPSVQSQLKKTNSDYAQVCEEYARLVYAKDLIEKRIAKLHGAASVADRDLRNVERTLKHETNADEIAKIQTKRDAAIAAKADVAKEIAAEQAKLTEAKKAVQVVKVKKKEMQTKLESDLLLQKLDKAQLEFKQASQVSTPEKLAAPLSPARAPVSLLFTAAPSVAPVAAALSVSEKAPSPKKS